MMLFVARMQELGVVVMERSEQTIGATNRVCITSALAT